MNRQIVDLQAQSKAKAIELATKQLNTPDSLKNLKELKASVQKQNEIFKNKLKTVLNGQIEEADVAMKTLKMSTEKHSIVQNYFRQINQTGKHSQELFDNYSLLRKTIITMSNIKKAKDSLDRILQFGNEINTIYDTLQKDHTQVWSAHERIVKLEEIRDAALAESEQEDYYLEIFKDYFKNINECSERFTNLIFVQTLENDGIIFTAQEEPAYLVQIARVIEEEEKRDKKRRKENGKQTFTSKKKTKETIVLKEYKKRFFNTITNQVHHGIAYAMKDKPKFYDKLKAVDRYMSKTLEDAELDVSTCFPEEYDILKFYIKTFENYVKDYVIELLNDREKLEYSDSLDLANWLMIHYPNALDPFLGPKDEVIDFEREALELLKEYIFHRKLKMIHNCEMAVKVDFEDATQPLPNDDNYPYTPACVEIFTMLNSQLDQLIESKMTWDSKFILDVVESASVILMQYCVLMNSNIEMTLDKISILKLCAFGNNVPMCRVLLDTYTNRILGILSSSYHEKAMNYLTRVSDVGLVDLATTVINGLIQILMEELAKLFKEMFGEKWTNFDTNPMRYIGKQIDLFQKTNYLEPALSKSFYEQFFKRFVLKYISALLTNKEVHIKSKYEDDESFLTKYSDDIEEIKLIFGDEKHCVDDEFMDDQMLPLAYLKSLIKDTFSAVDAVDEYQFSLSEFLGEYPQTWDIAVIIVNKSDIPNDVKVQLRKIIESDFLKIYNDGADPSCDHIFRHFITVYSISKRREEEKKMKKLKEQQNIQIQQAQNALAQKAKKQIKIPTKDEKKRESVPKEEKLDTVTLDDLDIDVSELEL
eukprot:gene629-8133_t